MSRLTIVAGPNGAGKSTMNKELMIDQEIAVFDFDREFHSIWSEFDFDSSVEEGAYNRTRDLFLAKKSDALLRNLPFAFEANFHDEEVLSTVAAFNAKGYHLDLIFIFLETPGVAIERVKDRVAKGSHTVEISAIHDRFFKGLDLLNNNFYRFDMIHLYHSIQCKVMVLV